MPNLVNQIENVIRWLRNGCDQQSAAVELQGITDEMRALSEPRAMLREVLDSGRLKGHELADRIRAYLDCSPPDLPTAAACGLRHGSSNADGGF